MNTFLLVAMLVSAHGYEMIGAAPAKTQAECEAVRQAILSDTYGKMVPGQQFVVSCVPIITAGSGV
jgi:hypothetical protein